jgi:hypothetical protein
MNIFQDESGCLGFNRGSSKYFIVALLCPENSKHLGHIIRKFKGKLIKSSWPKTVEIKATHLHMAKYNTYIPPSYVYKNNQDEPIENILKKLSKINCEIDVIVIKKANINSNLKTLPYGVLYNYFSKNVLIERIIKYDEVKLFIDRTSKQTHKMKHFDDYIYTEALMAKGHNFNFSIEHCDSNIVTGICAVDFVSWALSRKYEQNDNRFFQIIESKIKNHKLFLF